MKKDIFLVVLILALIGLSVAVFLLSEKSNQINKSLEEERYSRMVAEETVQKNAAKLTALEAQIKSTSERMAKVQATIDQEKGRNAELAKKYADLANAKEAMEAKFQAAVQQAQQQAAVAEPAATAAQ